MGHSLTSAPWRSLTGEQFCRTRKAHRPRVTGDGVVCGDCWIDLPEMDRSRPHALRERSTDAVTFKCLWCGESMDEVIPFSEIRTSLQENLSEKLEGQYRDFLARHEHPTQSIYKSAPKPEWMKKHPSFR